MCVTTLSTQDRPWHAMDCDPAQSARVPPHVMRHEVSRAQRPASCLTTSIVAYYIIEKSVEIFPSCVPCLCSLPTKQLVHSYHSSSNISLDNILYSHLYRAVANTICSQAYNFGPDSIEQWKQHWNSCSGLLRNLRGYWQGLREGNAINSHSCFSSPSRDFITQRLARSLVKSQRR